MVGSSTLYMSRQWVRMSVQPGLLARGIYASVSIASVAFGFIAVRIAREFSRAPKVMVQESEIEWSKRETGIMRLGSGGLDT
jgi:hypothetical protein